MAKSDIILATDKNGNDITIGTVENWIKEKDQKKLSQFLFDRLHGRYIKPFMFLNEEYEQKYKSGFTLMANCCLLIETYVSFRVKELKDTYGRSERCFGYFFVTEPRFSDFKTGGLTADKYLLDRPNPNKDSGVPHDFYKNVRCGILHSAETRNNWLITRKKEKPLLSINDATKEINATKFMYQLKLVLDAYKKELDDSDINKDIVWENFINRLKFLIENA